VEEEVVVLLFTIPPSTKEVHDLEPVPGTKPGKRRRRKKNVEEKEEIKMLKKE
jgi:hypothetical protein